MTVDAWKGEWTDDLRELDAGGRLRRLRTVEPLPGHHVRVGGRCCLNLASNDYLGFGCDPDLQAEFVASMGPTLGEYGFTASASRLLTGEHPAYAALERLLEDAYGHGRRALVLASGYHANIGVLPALADRGDVIFSDRLNHASLVDGIRLSRADWVRYRHGDLAHLRALLAARRPSARRAFIVTETIFSMDGDRADLVALAELRREFDAMLYVDEAHAVGVRGPTGLGLCEESGLAGDADVLVGTFGKAAASVGAFVMADPVIRERLVNTMRSLIFTTALPPVVLTWTRRVFERVLGAGDRRARLAANTARFRRELAQRQLAALGDTHIVPLVVGDDREAVRLSARLEESGYLAPPIRPPTVPEGAARLRFSLGAGMAPEALADLAGCIGSLRGGSA
jgi:8-amino-7-oxononanoate synthase